MNLKYLLSLLMLCLLITGTDCRAFMLGSSKALAEPDEGRGIGVLVIIHDHETDKIYYPVVNYRGDVMALVDADDGSTCVTYEYGPFGEPLGPGNAEDINPFRFSSKYLDEETGYYYYGYRYYDPETKQWLSREPLGEMASPHLYAFVNNDPINHVDYLGLEASLMFEFNDAGKIIRFGYQDNYPGTKGAGPISLHWFNKLNDAVTVPYDEFDIRFATAIGEEATNLYPWGSLGPLELLEAVERGYLSYWELPAEGLAGYGSTWDYHHNGYRAGINATNGQVFASTGLELAFSVFPVKGSGRLVFGKAASMPVLSPAARRWTSNSARWLFKPWNDTVISGQPIRAGNYTLMDSPLLYLDRSGKTVLASNKAVARATPNPTTGAGYRLSDPAVRILGPWTKQDIFNGLHGRPPKSLGRPDLHHAEQMPGAGIHEIVPSLHRGNKALHPGPNQGVTDAMRVQDRQLHWWYRARQQGAEQLYPELIYDP